MAKKTPRRKLIEKLDNIVKEIIRLRDDGLCQHCGKRVDGSNAHVSHVIPRSRGKRLRWDLLNLVLFCFHCHINWWHKNPLICAGWFSKTFSARYSYLMENEFVIVKYSDNDLQELYERLQEKLNDLKVEIRGRSS